MAHVRHEAQFFFYCFSLFDGQIEVNRNLRNLLRTLVGEHIENWDIKLVTVEFAYNTSVNRTTGKSPHEIVYDFRPSNL